MKLGIDSKGQTYIEVQNIRITRKDAVFNGECGLQIAALLNGKPMHPVQIPLPDEKSRVEFLKVIADSIWQ